MKLNQARWPQKALSILLTLVPAFQDWEKLKIIYYRVADAIAEVLFWPPPERTPHPPLSPQAGRGKKRRGLIFA